MRDDFSDPFVQNVRNFRQLWETFGYEGLIGPVPSGPLYPKSTALPIHAVPVTWRYNGLLLYVIT